MTDLKFNLLGMLYEASPLHPLKELDLINSGYAEPVKIDDAIEDLVTQDYIKASLTSNNLKITSLGRIAYESEKEKRYDNACNKRQQSFNNKIAIASLLMSPIVFFLGVIVEHRAQLVELIFSLFK